MDIQEELESNYQVKRSDIVACQFHLWYPQFRKARVTIPSIIIPLQPYAGFRDYLLSDGCFLPQNTTSSMFLEKSNSKEEGHGDFCFPELDKVIEKCIEKLGGFVMPKLNWSSPKDASWMNCNGSLKCQCAGDIYLLLKSSDFIVHDLLYAFDGCFEENEENQHQCVDEGEIETELQLVLRKWSNLYPSMEFRCFVSNHRIIGVSQRNYSQYYAHLHKQKSEIGMDLIDFYDDSIRGKFAKGKISYYVFDCYIDKNRRVWLIDFNVWGSKTDSLLYTWDELNILSKQRIEDVATDIADVLPEIRLVDCPKEVHPDPLSSYRVPIDTVDLASNSFQEFMAMCKRPSSDDSSSSSESN